MKMNNKKIEFYGDAVYNVTGSEMDERYERCTRCNGGSTCMYNVWIASTDDNDKDYITTSWCTKRKEI